MTKWNDFDIIWNKESPKSRQKLMQKLICRDIEPTKENCRDYWMGYIRYYINPITGHGRHVNPRKNKAFMKQMKRLRNDNQTRKRSKKSIPRNDADGAGNQQKYDAKTWAS